MPKKQWIPTIENFSCLKETTSTEFYDVHGCVRFDWKQRKQRVSRQYLQHKLLITITSFWLQFIIDTWYINFYDILINVADKRFQKKKYITTIRLHTHKNVSASLWNKKQKLGQNSSSLLKRRAIKWKKCDRQHFPDLESNIFSGNHY